MAKLLDSLIADEPIPQAMEVVEEKRYEWNVFPLHKK